MDQHHLIPRLDGYQLNPSLNYKLDGYTSSGSVSSEPIPLTHWRSYSVAVSCPATGSPSGTVKLQGCDDKERIFGIADDRLVNWFDISGASSALSGASLIVIDHGNASYKWLRVVYTRSSGSITITVNVQLKEFSR